MEKPIFRKSIASIGYPWSYTTAPFERKTGSNSSIFSYNPLFGYVSEIATFQSNLGLISVLIQKYFSNKECIIAFHIHV